MEISVIGATGTLGRPVVRLARERGHTVRELGRSSPTYPVDLATGAGLAEALAGCDVVVDVSQGPRETLVDGTRNLLAATAEAGTPVVGVSIVGCREGGLRYYGIKAEQEELLLACPRARVVAATQFHQLLDGLLGSAARYGFGLRSGAPFQPVLPDDVAAVLVDVADGTRAGRVTTVVGPRKVTLTDLSRHRARVTGHGRVPLPLPAPRPIRSGSLTSDAADVIGTTTWEQWLRAGR
ncbi:SDR family oxidoreductase [Cellulomonas sp. PhB143]|uniref:SDR family oxidoreductase n=1 Tax=Cellulomonas sp. PhB143 TaxID=2485186 RepID=UPI000F479E93|nr:NAD(P)H-binding protein [Cellulomonas sp. PhB143]ROS78879.1 uncharacterized protein YbjT (DUF2867 family) [Cellulomonas sp. PhB143]